MKSVKKCRVCKKPSQHPLCSYQCAVVQHEARIANKERIEQGKQRKIDRQKHRADKERIKTRSQWIKETQAEFNRFIRLRDKDQPCISCRKFDNEITDKYTGGKWDAGHYLTRGGFPEIRFEESNCHKQCKSCNHPGPNKAARVQIAYRVNLIAKIGLPAVEWLEGPHSMPKWSIDELKAIKAHYRAEIKRLT